MANHRVYRLNLSPEEVLERLRSCRLGIPGEDPRSCPYEIRIEDPSFRLNDTGFLAPSMTGTVRKEEHLTRMDLRLSLHFLPTAIVVALGLLFAQAALRTALGIRPLSFSTSQRWETIAGVIGLTGISGGLLWTAWRPRRLRAASYWTFLDRLFADVKVGEEEL